ADRRGVPYAPGPTRKSGRQAPAFSRRRSLRPAQFAQGVLDELARDAEATGKLRQVLRIEPLGVRKLRRIGLQLAAGVLRAERDHQRVGERPALAAEVAQPVDLDADLLAHLAAHGFLDGFAGLEEACERAVHVRAEVDATPQQQLAA